MHKNGKIRSLNYTIWLYNHKKKKCNLRIYTAKLGVYKIFMPILFLVLCNFFGEIETFKQNYAYAAKVPL